MFGISFSELCIIAFAIFVCVGPKKFPDLLRQAGRLFVQLRRMSNEVKSGWEEIVREAETEARKPAQKISKEATPPLPPSAHAQPYEPEAKEKKEAIDLL